MGGARFSDSNEVLGEAEDCCHEASEMGESVGDVSVFSDSDRGTHATLGLRSDEDEPFCTTGVNCERRSCSLAAEGVSSWEAGLSALSLLLLPPGGVRVEEDDWADPTERESTVTNGEGGAHSSCSEQSCVETVVCV